MQTVAALCRVLLSDARSDGALVTAFAAEQNEAAFLELVRRHGPLVWGVCRRLLPHPADAEDAFQASFLVLVSRSHKLGARDAVGPWLHRVAVLTARNLRRKNARRLARQRDLPADTSTTAPDADLKADLDGALLALPDRYRAPIILCHLQGFTRREAAAHLGCAEGTLSAWLNRGLAKLRARLRDLDPAKALSVPAVAVPAALATSTVQAAVASGAALATVPPAVSSLVEGVLHMFWIKKATAAAFALCTVFAVGLGVGLGTRTGSAGAVAQGKSPAGRAQPNEPPGAGPTFQEKSPARSKAEPLPVIDWFVDPKGEWGRWWRPDVLKTGPNQRWERPGVLVKDIAQLRKEIDQMEANLSSSIQEAQEHQRQIDSCQKQIDEQLKSPNREAAQPAINTLDATRGIFILYQKHAAHRITVLRPNIAAAKERLREFEHAAQMREGCVEITVAGTAEKPEFLLREVASEPKNPIGPIRVSDSAVLEVLLVRAAHDPHGPHAARVRVGKDVPVALVRTALTASKSAGFLTVALIEPHNTTAETIFRSGAEIDEYLKKAAPTKP